MLLLVPAVLLQRWRVLQVRKPYHLLQCFGVLLWLAVAVLERLRTTGGPGVNARWTLHRQGYGTSGPLTGTTYGSTQASIGFFACDAEVCSSRAAVVAGCARTITEVQCGVA